MDKNIIIKLKGEGIIAQKQEGYFSVRILTMAGNISSQDLVKIANMAEKYGKGYIGVTTRLSVELPWVKFEDIDKVKEEISKAGLMHGGTGKKVRPLVACKGTVCTHGIFDTQKLCSELHDKYFGEDMPSKFKIGIVGCPNNCAKASLNDIGFMGQKKVKFDFEKCKNCGLCINVCRAKVLEKGENNIKFQEDKCVNCGACEKICPFEAISIEKEGISVFVGGKFGRQYRIGDRINNIFKVEDADRIVKKITDYHKERAMGAERLSSMVDRIGWENVEKDLL